MSVAIFGTELPSRNFVLSTQCPPIIARFHQKFTGVHWNITTSTCSTLADTMESMVTILAYNGNVPGYDDAP
jgi:hypothetical protein